MQAVRRIFTVRERKRQHWYLREAEEPGKTKIVECVNTAPLAVLSTVSPGEEISLKAKNHVVEVRNQHNTYLGALPDDLSFRLIKFLAVGNTYQALVKSVRKNSLVVFLRELTRGKRFATQPSFTTTALYVPFTKVERDSEPVETESNTESGENED